MRRSLIAAALLAALSASQAYAGPEIGSPAPGFNAVAADGAPVSLESLAGRTVVLEWTNHECPFVQRHYEAGTMQATQNAAREAGAVWVSVISSAPGKQGHVSAETALSLNADRNAPVDHVIVDAAGEIGRLFEAKTTPHMFVIGPDGTLRYNGAIDDKPTADAAKADGATNFVITALGALAAGEAVDPAETKPYGCSVKYRS